MPSGVDRRPFWVGAGAIVAVDIATKLIAEGSLAFRQAVPVLGDTFQLRLVYNPARRHRRDHRPRPDEPHRDAG
jgi:hypothetical protein